jgi:hypothetical protein
MQLRLELTEFFFTKTCLKLEADLFEEKNQSECETFE